MALNKARIEYDLVGWSEIDKFAIKAHNLIWPQWSKLNFGDISKIDWERVPDFDLFTYSFPCTDISGAGSKKGLIHGEKSSLLWECERAIKTKKPMYLIMENVKDILNKKNLPDFKVWLNILSQIGYTNYINVLDSQSFGVPQHRERTFVVSILGNQIFEFPIGHPLQFRLKDFLEDEVDPKYFLSSRAVSGIISHCSEKRKQGYGLSTHFSDATDICRTITTKYGQRQTDTYIDTAKMIQVGNFIQDKGYKNPIRGRVYSVDGICPTLNTGQGGGHISQITSDLSSIRRLTPRECFRLMGVSEHYIDVLVNSNLSNTQLYKMAGNSIVVNVLCEIIKKLLV